MSFSIEKIEKNSLSKFRHLLSIEQRNVLDSLENLQSHKLFGATVKGEAVGLIWGSPASDMSGMVVHQIYVLKAWRREHIGRALIECFSGHKLLFRYQEKELVSDSLVKFLEAQNGSFLNVNIEFKLNNLERVKKLFSLSSRREEHIEVVPLAQALELIDSKTHEEMLKRECLFEAKSKGELSYKALKDVAFLSPFWESNHKKWGRGCLKNGKLVGWICGEQKKEFLHIRRIYVDREIRGESLIHLMIQEVAKENFPVYWEVRFWSKSFQEKCFRYRERLGIEVVNRDILNVMEV